MALPNAARKKMSRKKRQEITGYLPPPNAVRGEQRESRFRPLWMEKAKWASIHRDAINRRHPAALA